MTNFFAAADGLNIAIKEAEAALVESNLRVTAEVDLGEKYILVFKPMGNVWGLYLLNKLTQEECPLTTCSLDARVTAVSKLEDLHEAIISASINRTAEVLKATHMALQFAQKLRNCQ